MNETHFTMPDNLDAAGQLAFQTITTFFQERGLMSKDLCFFSPADWKARGEEYGLASKLILVYDGCSLGAFFSLDRDYPKYNRYEEMRAVLSKAGLFAEECTGWYCAVYPA